MDFSKVNWQPRHFGPLERLSRQPVSSKPMPRAPKPRVVPMGWARRLPPFGLTEMEIEYYHLARILEETAYLPWGVQQVVRHPSLEPITMAKLNETRRAQPQEGLKHTPTPATASGK